MKNEVIDLFAQLGIAWKYLVNGLIGGAVWATHKGASFWVAFRQILIGGIVAGYATDMIADKVGIRYVGFLSFTIGMIGMVMIDSLYEMLLKKIKAIFK